MKPNYLGNLSPEEREVCRLKASESRKARKLFAKENLIMDYGEDEGTWLELARKFSVRLPNKTLPNTDTKYLKRMCNTLGADFMEYLSYCGFTKSKDFSKANPQWTARAECGMILEWWDEKVRDEQ